ncbi:hypothetical protein HanIR_Chr04g0200741 [Helianthus annuus]|nr:hypothetical protein HanIR_Chr04g0200741 [Helianthus annuus]
MGSSATWRMVATVSRDGGMHSCHVGEDGGNVVLAHLDWFYLSIDWSCSWFINSGKRCSWSCSWLPEQFSYRNGFLD